jgi:hypothetical protein
MELLLARHLWGVRGGSESGASGIGSTTRNVFIPDIRPGELGVFPDLEIPVLRSTFGQTDNWNNQVKIRRP